MVTLSPTVIEEPETVTWPDVIVLLLPSIVTVPWPIERIPVTLALPCTRSAVFPTPIVTVPIPLDAPRVVIPDTNKCLWTITSCLAVIIPIESILVTSS